MGTVARRWLASLVVSAVISTWLVSLLPAQVAPSEPPPTPTSPAVEPVTQTQEPPAELAPLEEKLQLHEVTINLIWVLLTGCMVMFMQAGFTFVETGLCRGKNASHTAAMNLMIYPLGCLAFWGYGFAIGWGNVNNAPSPPATLGAGTEILSEGLGIEPVLADGKPTGAFKYGLLGAKGFFLTGIDDFGVLTLFFFMMVFMDTTATIPTGAMAERWSWKNFCLYGMWVALPYCIYANWVWGGGWLAQSGLNWNLGHGAVDFAGSGVVHAMGGFIGLAGAIVLGPRLGKYVNGQPRPIPGHNVPMVVLGTFILAFGWFGFNAGSTLAGTDVRIGAIIVNTMLASVAGPVAAMMTLYFRRMKPDPTMLCNGMLAGLVAVTAPCAFIDSWAAVVIGLIAGVLVVQSVLFLEEKGIDDPVGAVSVHGVNGLWGLIALGIFANGAYGDGWNGVSRAPFVKRFGSDGVRGFLYGDVTQLGAQVLSAGVVAVFAFTMAYIWFKFSDRLAPIRVAAAVEQSGLDVPEMGAVAYPDYGGRAG